MKGIKFFQKLHQRKIQRATQVYLDDLENRTVRAAPPAYEQFAQRPGTYHFGDTAQGQRIALPPEETIAHALLVGASGAGKSYSGLQLALQMLSATETGQPPSFGVLDPKGELFALVLNYLYALAYRLPARQRENLRRKIFILDFSNDTCISPYHLLAFQPGVPAEVLVASRIEMISEQFSGLAPLTVRMQQCLKPFLQLMVEFQLPLPLFISFVRIPPFWPLLWSGQKTRSRKNTFFIGIRKKGKEP